jgi:hypothetical protein
MAITTGTYKYNLENGINNQWAPSMDLFEHNANKNRIKKTKKATRFENEALKYHNAHSNTKRIHDWEVNKGVIYETMVSNRKTLISPF